MPQPRMLNAACLCRAVRLEVRDEFEYVQICHCSDCRRATGSASKPFAGIARAKLRFLQGEDNLLRFGGDQAHDIRCRTCGSLLFSAFPPRDWVHLVLGSLLDPPSRQPSCHIWVSDKAPWDPIADGLPQHEGFPP
ncbi:MAG TPA: GFA family protein [Lacunisphaera sp.]|nr:GFA family protein [Lacunisphaera sp.]